MDITDQFGQWRQKKNAESTPITLDPIGPGVAYTGDTTNVISNAVNDVVNKFGQWWQGAKQGSAEVARAAQQMPSMSAAEMPGGAGLTPDEQAALEYNQRAVGNFTQETIKPVAYTAGLVAPIVAAPFLAADATTLVEEKGPLEAAKELTGISAVQRAIENPKEFGERFYKEPVTTATELLPAALLARGGYQAVKARRGAMEKPAEVKPLETMEAPEQIAQKFGEWRENKLPIEETLAAKVNEVIPETQPAMGLSIQKVKAQETTATPEVRFSDPTIETRWQEASKGIQRESIISKAREKISSLSNKITREYEDLPKTAEFAQARSDLLKLEKQKGVASDRTARILQGITVELDKPAYDLFRRKVVLDDLAQDKSGRLPYGFTPETLAAEKAKIDAAVQSNPKIAQAAQTRTQTWEAIKSDYVQSMKDIGFDVSDRLGREDYFRHQVLEYANARALTGTGQKLKTPTNRGFLKEREGSAKDINADYLQAEFEVMGQMMYDTELARTIKSVWDNYDISPQLRQQFGDKWRENIPEGYTTWQPREGSSFYLANSIPEKVATQLFEGALKEIGVKAEDIGQVLARGSRFKEFIVKQELADTLNKVSQPPTESAIGKISRSLVTPWKLWTLMSPTRFIKYELRNITGDADAVLSMNPSAFKKVPQATKELYQAVINERAMTPEMREWFKRGGFESGLMVNELPQINQLKMFDRFRDSDPNIIKKAWEGYWTKVRKYNTFRESGLRYATYLDYLEQMQKDGKPRNFGASKPEEIMAIKDIRDRAYKLSNELLGAYDAVSVLGKDLRSSVIPFWSWYETNFRRYSQFFKNEAVEGRLAYAVGKSLLTKAAVRSPFYVYQVGSFAVKASALWAGLQAYNYLVWPEEEKSLPPDEAARPHIILGKNPDGTIKYFNRLGAFGDFLEWFGLDTPAKTVTDYLNGKLTLQDVAKEIAQSPVNKLAQGVSPTIKTPAELFAGEQYFPDAFKPRKISDRTQYLAQAAGLGSEFKSFSRTDAGKAIGIAPRPGERYNPETLLYYKTDPNRVAYSNIIDAKRKFLEKAGKAGEGGFDTPKSQALKNYKSALKFNDKETAEYYLNEYKKLGGTKEGLKKSLEALDPLAGLNTKDKKVFLTQLTGKEREELAKAIKYYKSVLANK